MTVTLKHIGNWNPNKPDDPGHCWNLYWAETDCGFCDIIYDDDDIIPDGTYEMSMEKWEEVTSMFDTSDEPDVQVMEVCDD